MAAQTDTFNRAAGSVGNGWTSSNNALYSLDGSGNLIFTPTTDSPWLHPLRRATPVELIDQAWEFEFRYHSAASIYGCHRLRVSESNVVNCFLAVLQGNTFQVRSITNNSLSSEWVSIAIGGLSNGSDYIFRSWTDQISETATRVYCALYHAADRDEIYLDSVDRTDAAHQNVAGDFGIFCYAAQSGTTQVMSITWNEEEVVPPVGQSIAVNNAAIYYSPLTWHKEGSDYAQTVNVGAYSKFRFTGTFVAADIDPSMLSGLSSGNMPKVYRKIDGVWSSEQLVSGQEEISITGLAAGNHEVEFWLGGVPWDSNRWNETTPLSALRITGYRIDEGASVFAPTIKPYILVVFADSHGEGREVIAPGDSVANQDPRIAYPVLLAEELNAEVAVICFGGQGYSGSFGGNNVPGLKNSVGFIYNTRTRLVDGEFPVSVNYAVVMMGDNDSAGAGLQADSASSITSIRAAAPDAWLFVAPPPNYNAEGKLADIQAGVAAAAAADPHFIDTGTNFLALYPSGVHLSEEGQIAVKDALFAGIAAVAPLPSVTGVSVSPATVTLYGGQTQQFTALVTGENDPSQAVTWGAEDEDGNPVEIINSSGLLTAPGGMASGAQVFTVTATSNADNTKAGTATVTIPIHQAGGSGGGAEYPTETEFPAVVTYP